MRQTQAPHKVGARFEMYSNTTVAISRAIATLLTTPRNSSALTLAGTASLWRRHHWIQRWSRSGLVYRQRLPALVEARLVLSLTS
jgi:hypothetical protein